MNKILLILLLVISTFVACKKDKTVCFQTDVTLDYDTFDQFDSAYTTPKVCMLESQTSTMTFESQLDPISGQIYIKNEVGSSIIRMYDTQRSDSLTRTINTYTVPE